MAGGCAWSRRVGGRARTLRALVKDTQHALHDVEDILAVDPEVSSQVAAIGHKWSLGTALVVCGCTSAAKVRLLHALLGRRLLPEQLPRGSRWIRIQYGSSTQVHLSVGNSEFELVEELECNKKPWDVLPEQDLIRQGPSDLSTIIEIELNNQFLRDGLHIVIPPDIDCDPGISTHLQLKSIHQELYNKRASILKTFHPVYLYAIDKMGKNIFYENIGSAHVSKSEDFWNTYSFFNMTKDVGFEKNEELRNEKVVWSERGEPTVFSAENCLDFHQFRELDPHSQFLFILFSDAVEVSSSRVTDDGEATESTRDDALWSEELPEADRGMIHTVMRQSPESPDLKNSCKKTEFDEQIAFMNDLIDQWELMSSPPQKHYVKSQCTIIDDLELLRNDSRNSTKNKQLITSRTVLLNLVVKFATDCLHTYLLEYCTKLSEIHVKLLQQFILASFDMARELQVVPKKIQYVAIQEHHLYQTIHEKFSEGNKKQELVHMMEEVLRELEIEVQNMDWSVDDLPWHQEHSTSLSLSSPCASPRPPPACPRPPPVPPPCDPPSDGEDATYLEEYDIIASTEDSYSSFINKPSEEPSTDIRVENETEMLSVSSVMTWSSDVTTCTNNTSIKHATLDVQQTVLSRLSRKISLKLVKFVDCLKDSYFGTLQRCLESLERSCRAELGGRPASEAMRHLLSVPRHVQLHPYTAFSFVRTLLDSLRRLLHKMRLSGGSEDACCGLSARWRRQVALHAARGLSAHRLARIISQQILERLSSAHEKYQAALTSLETALANRLHHTEDIKLAIRKRYAPSFARLCLESTSMCDLLMYGTPELGREIGRGQYGVVFCVRGTWARRAPLAAKSVLPADTRHYHDLAMEFFYTRSIPPHPRIVRLYGSIVQRGGSSGSNSRAVLLVSERKLRDLHAAVRAGLTLRTRMRIAADIVEGIRYLHSLGLVHRDIKLKNVLLDSEHRASLSDLGFCAAGALISGSVVGTPVHMAPELLAGDYTASVDVYAFGILFWYLCAGDVRLPAAFEVFNNKEQLWSKVKKGLRPERLPHFTDECWNLMEACWHPEPGARPLPGDLQPALNSILRASDSQPSVQRNTVEDSLERSSDYDL